MRTVAWIVLITWAIVAAGVVAWAIYCAGYDDGHETARREAEGEMDAAA